MGGTFNSDRVWIAFFSQTGSEIVELAEKLGRWPDVVVTNRRPDYLRTIHPKIEDSRYIILPNKPTVEDYEDILEFYDNPLITLHGWLRIMPAEICRDYEIYNGHPGLVTRYPELKGKDPQIRAYREGYKTAGCVLHKVTEGVDEGEVLDSMEINIEQLTLDEVFLNLREVSSLLWLKLLYKLILNEKDDRISRLFEYR
jgi:folate-dependent phosphoribosylglycinamide formyltransferase PurN